MRQLRPDPPGNRTLCHLRAVEIFECLSQHVSCRNSVRKDLGEGLISNAVHWEESLHQPDPAIPTLQLFVEQLFMLRCFSTPHSTAGWPVAQEGAGGGAS